LTNKIQNINKKKQNQNKFLKIMKNKKQIKMTKRLRLKLSKKRRCKNDKNTILEKQSYNKNKRKNNFRSSKSNRPRSLFSPN